MPVPDDDAAELFRGAYAALAERTPEAPTFEEITSRLPDPPMNGRLRGAAQPDHDPEVVDLRRPHTLARPAPSRRPTAIVLAVAAALLLVGGMVVADGNRDSVVTEAASTPTAEVPVGPAAAIEPGTLLWPQMSFENGKGFMGVVAAGPGFVAVGAQDSKAAVWTSADGLSWSRVPHDEAVFGGGGELQMTDITVGGPGLVAVGSQSVCTDLPVLDAAGSVRVDEVGVPEPDTVCSDGNAAVWTSPDGLTWSRVPHHEAVFGGPDFQEMTAVTAGGPGLVAVGMSRDFRGDETLVEGESLVDVGAVVWTSVDGLTWTRAPQDETVFGGPGWQSMLDVTVGGPGLVAVGQDGGRQFWGNDLDHRPAVWTSADGLTWTKVPNEDAFGRNSTMLGVTAGGPGLVAVGEWGGGRGARVWISTDGRSWSQVTHDNPADMGGFMWDVIVGGPGLIAVGCCEVPEQVWISPDGLNWSPAPNVSFARPGQ